jgi:hypothetical protein
MKRYLILLFVFVALGLTSIVGINAVLDPFRIYHDPVMEMPYGRTERYRIAGLINEGLYRNKDADTVLIGTSMSDNTDVFDLAKKLKTPRVLKLIFSGGLPAEHILVLDYALASQQVKKVIWERHSPYFYQEMIPVNDEAILAKEAWKFFPDYLYDRIWFNDVAYLLSADTAKSFLKTQKDLRKGRDNLLGWEINDAAGIDEEYKRWNAPENKKSVKDAILARDTKRDCAATVDPESLAAVASFVGAHAEVDFVFMIPPLHFSNLATMSYCDAKKIIDSQKKYAEQLLKMDNVSLYAFADREDIVLPFANYKDSGHYMTPINDRLSGYIAMGQGRLTADNMDRYFAALWRIYETGMARSDIENPAP